MDEDLSFCLGYYSTEVTDEKRLAILAQRCADEQNQITGNLLNNYQVLHINQKLTSGPLATQINIYNDEAKSIGEKPCDIDTKIVSGCNYVAEPKNLMPAITVTAGNIFTNQVEFIIQYIPPICD